MMNKYANQNHYVNRKIAVIPKTASIYDRQSISNRQAIEKELTFSNLSPYESESILNVMKKEASELESMGLEKKAAGLASPFEYFRNTKALISSKLGLSDDVAHDLSSSIVGRANSLQDEVGGELEPIIGGIIESIDPQEVQNKVGVVSMRKSSPNEIEEHLKMRLTEEMQLSAFQADNVVKNIMAQARNLSTQFRQHDTMKIADAIMDVIVNHQDISVVYNMSSSQRLVKEVESQLNHV